eukprot:scaffold975_cov90-Cylindrotheca_fusiformis.AAC.3
MKQFDVGKDGDSGFNKEVEAYRKLQEVWGVLVPKPLFLSESISGGVQFLGLQLGRDPTLADDLSLWGSVVQRLEKEFGIRHNDAVRRNQLYLPDENGVERLVAIDFEDWDEQYLTDKYVHRKYAGSTTVPTSKTIGSPVQTRQRQESDLIHFKGSSPTGVEGDDFLLTLGNKRSVSLLRSQQQFPMVRLLGGVPGTQWVGLFSSSTTDQVEPVFLLPRSRTQISLPTLACRFQPKYQHAKP